MRKPYQKPVISVSPDVKVPESKISKFVIFLVRVLSTFYFRMLFGNAKVKLHNEKILIDAFKRALSGESRIIIAFRHPDGREPQLLMWYFLFKLKSIANKNNVKFKIRPHVIFIYGYEVVRWGGGIARFFMPNLGAVPIHHTKLDSKGMAKINSAICDGPYPVAVAPEGQVSYSINSVPRLETGSIRIGLSAAGKTDVPVEILPVSVFFRYNSGGKKSMLKLLSKIEKACGFYGKQVCKLSLSERLKQCRDFILEMNEKRYKLKTDTAVPYEQRLDAVINAALETAESSLGIKQSDQDFFTRLYNVRHQSWDKIFLPDTDTLNGIPELERSIKDLSAGEAYYVSRHQELADFGWYFKHEIPAEDTPLHATIEYVQNLWDFANRTMGGAISRRINIPSGKIIIGASPVINLTSYLDEFKNDKKTTVNNITELLKNEYTDCINEVNSIY